MIRRRKAGDPLRSPWSPATRAPGSRSLFTAASPCLADEGHVRQGHLTDRPRVWQGLADGGGAVCLLRQQQHLIAIAFQEVRRHSEIVLTARTDPEVRNSVAGGQPPPLRDENPNPRS